MSTTSVICHVDGCRYNPKPGVGFCEHKTTLVLGFFKMVEGINKGQKEPLMKCWMFEKEDFHNGKEEDGEGNRG